MTNNPADAALNSRVQALRRRIAAIENGSTLTRPNLKWSGSGTGGDGGGGGDDWHWYYDQLDDLTFDYISSSDHGSKGPFNFSWSNRKVRTADIATRVGLGLVHDDTFDLVNGPLYPSDGLPLPDAWYAVSALHLDTFDILTLPDDPPDDGNGDPVHLCPSVEDHAGDPVWAGDVFLLVDPSAGSTWDGYDVYTTTGGDKVVVVPNVLHCWIISYSGQPDFNEVTITHDFTSESGPHLELYSFNPQILMTFDPDARTLQFVCYSGANDASDWGSTADNAYIDRTTGFGWIFDTGVAGT